MRMVDMMPRRPADFVVAFAPVDGSKDQIRSLLVEAA